MLHSEKHQRFVILACAGMTMGAIRNLVFQMSFGLSLLAFV